MFFIVLGLIYGEYRIMKRQLPGEVASGLISELQYQKALIPLTLTFAGFSGKDTLRFYRLLGKRTHIKKNNLESLAKNIGIQISSNRCEENWRRWLKKAK